MYHTEKWIFSSIKLFSNCIFFDRLNFGDSEKEIKKIGHNAFFHSTGRHSDPMNNGLENKKISHFLTLIHNLSFSK